VLKRLTTFECRDAVLSWDGEPQVRRDAAGQVVNCPTPPTT
jgi:hypothetical protein